jgi:hypothetical protein
MSDDLLGNELWQQVPAQSCFDVQLNPTSMITRVRCSISGITSKGLYKWRVLVRGEIASQCINCFMRVIPSGKLSLTRSVISDLSQNFHNAPQTVAMGKFNMFPKKNFLYMKIALKDEFDNLYLHEDVSSIQSAADALTYQLINANVVISLTVTEIAKGQSDNCLYYKFMLQSN